MYFPHIFYLLMITCSFSIQSITCRAQHKDSSIPNCYKNFSSSDTANRCIHLHESPYCLGLKLPYYSLITPNYLSEYNIESIQDAGNYLERWHGAKMLPRCWPHIQAALCSVLMPQCIEDPITGKAVSVHRPNVDICHDLVNKNDCKFLGRRFGGWPSLFNCSDTNLYDRNCSNKLRELKHSSPYVQPACQYPLVPTNDNSTWFKDISGCAIHCKFPISNPPDLANVKFLITTLSFTGLVTTILAIILMLSNKTMGILDKSSHTVIFHCSICQLLLYIGWSLQIFFDSDIACSSSGTSMYGVPLVANSCILSFILTYLPSLSSLLWVAHLVKLYHKMLKDKPSRNLSMIDRTPSRFNYGIPLILFVSVVFLGHIDGHGLFGICTVGQQSLIIKAIFVLAPTIMGTLYGNYYFIKIVIKLAHVRGPVIVEAGTQGNFIRICALAALTLIQALFTSLNYFYEQENRTRWLDSIDDYIGCQMRLDNLDPQVSQDDFIHRKECNINTKPTVELYYLELISTLSIGIVIASWTFREPYTRRLPKISIVCPEGDRVKKGKYDDQSIDDIQSNSSLASVPIILSHGHGSRGSVRCELSSREVVNNCRQLNSLMNHNSNQVDNANLVTNQQMIMSKLYQYQNQYQNEYQSFIMSKYFSYKPSDWIDFEFIHGLAHQK